MSGSLLRMPQDIQDRVCKTPGRFVAFSPNRTKLLRALLLREPMHFASLKVKMMANAQEDATKM